MRIREEIRSTMEERYWHICVCALVASGLLGLADITYLMGAGALPSLKEIWWLALIVPLLCGSAVTIWAGGAPLSRRIAGALVCGGCVGLLYTAISGFLGYGALTGIGKLAVDCVWRMFLFMILSVFGVILTEAQLPEANNKGSLPHPGDSAGSR